MGYHLTLVTPYSARIKSQRAALDLLLIHLATDAPDNTLSNRHSAKDKLQRAALTRCTLIKSTTLRQLLATILHSARDMSLKIALDLLLTHRVNDAQVALEDDLTGKGQVAWAIAAPQLIGRPF